jgi:hypothetical protein
MAVLLHQSLPVSIKEICACNKEDTLQRLEESHGKLWKVVCELAAQP